MFHEHFGEIRSDHDVCENTHILVNDPAHLGISQRPDGLETVCSAHSRGNTI